MSTKQQELLQSQTSVENSNSDNNNSLPELLTIEPLENTPFKVVGNDETGYFIALGKYKITNHYEDATKAIEYLKTNQWNVIISMVGAILKAENLINEQ